MYLIRLLEIPVFWMKLVLSIIARVNFTISNAAPNEKYDFAFLSCIQNVDSGIG